MPGEPTSRDPTSSSGGDVPQQATDDTGVGGGGRAATPTDGDPYRWYGPSDQHYRGASPHDPYGQPQSGAAAYGAGPYGARGPDGPQSPYGGPQPSQPYSWPY